MAADERTELELLREIARWTREAALPVVRERVERLLDTDQRRGSTRRSRPAPRRR